MAIEIVIIVDLPFFEMVVFHIVMSTFTRGYLEPTSLEVKMVKSQHILPDYPGWMWSSGPSN